MGGPGANASFFATTRVVPHVTLVATLLAGVLFGLALAAPPGPMNAIIAEENVLRGWGAGFRAGLGAMTADMAFFLLTLVSAVSIVDRFPTVRAVMIALGGLLMWYFAYAAVAGARAVVRPDGRLDPESRGFSKTLVLACTNPYQILFWLTIGVGLLRPGEFDVLAYLPAAVLRTVDVTGVLVVRTGSPVLLVGLFGGILVWIVAFPAALVGAVVGSTPSPRSSPSSARS